MEEIFNQLGATQGGAGFDWTYILVALGAMLSMWASSLVKSRYARYS